MEAGKLVGMHGTSNARQVGAAAVLVALLLGGGLALATNDRKVALVPATSSTVEAAASPAPTGTADSPASPPQAADTLTTAAGDAGANEPADDDATDGPVIQNNGPTSDDDGTASAGCTLTKAPIALGATGDDVRCIQKALKVNNHYDGEPSGTFDDATDRAVQRWQKTKSLFVDGMVGKQTAESLGIWSGKLSMVVRTPRPPKGAKDLTGFPLSSVASAGADAPPLPPRSGSGRRLVYSRAQQRVWAVSDDGRILRSWLVSGSNVGKDTPGTYRVYSRSTFTRTKNGNASMKLMVRFLPTKRGSIGFHDLPIHLKGPDKGRPYQTEAELGTKLSGGCVRQARTDAEFTWKWAQLGTKVVVL